MKSPRTTVIDYARTLALFAGLLLATAPRLHAQTPSSLAPGVRDFVKISAPLIALTHVRVIDGTGSPARAEQTILISGDKIQSIGDSASASIPAGAQVLDLSGKTVIPGLVGMHDHMFYPAGGRPALALYNEMAFSFPRLYLASGVTSLRTTGSIEPYTDLELKKLIDAGKLAGPKIHVTGPYLEGAGSFTPQMHELTGPDDARNTVNYWADEGATSFKAYMNITRAELAAAVAAAHKRNIKVTGHLCSIGFKEAAAIGIDDLEHGLLVDTEFDPGKAADVCPSQQLTAQTIASLDVESAPVQETIRELVAHHVAVTSTIAIFETFVPNQPPLEHRVIDAMLPQAAVNYLGTRARVGQKQDELNSVLLKKEMQFERDFVKAGGILLAGEDPTGYGGDLAGFGDQRELELLAQAGFTPVEAVHIYTENGARFLGEEDHVGTLAAGKQADIVVVSGDLAADISAIERTELVFKDGAGYDSAKLIESVKGNTGFN